MKILTDLKAEISDHWRKLPAGVNLPDVGDWIVDLPRLQKAWPSLPGRHGRIGVLLEPEQPVEALVEDPNRLAIVLLRFPGFTDGRAFSQARLLRDRLGFSGDIRATGEVVPDLVAFMASCGINQFELTPQDAAIVFEIAAAERRAFANVLARTGDRSTARGKSGLPDTGTL
jgi:uncharacterized protein (DUF934 family)